MALTTVALTVPAGNGTGPAIDVHTLDAQKSFVLDGSLSPGEALVVEATEDAAGLIGWVGVTAWTNSNPGDITLPVVAAFLRIVRTGSIPGLSNPTASVAATTNGTNTYFSLPVPAMGAGTSGVGAAVDVSAGGQAVSFSVHSGQAGGVFGDGEALVVEGSNDNASWNSLVAFTKKTPPGFLGTSFKFLRVRRQNSSGAAASLFAGTTTSGTGSTSSAFLSTTYANGLVAPTVNNIFAQPGGKRFFSSTLDWGAAHLDAADEWLQSRTAIDLSRPPAARLLSQAANLSGIGGGGCGTFDILALNDPSWNGTFGALVNMEWIAEQAVFSLYNTDTGIDYTGTTFAKRHYVPNSLSPFVPNVAQIGAAMAHQIDLFNATAAASTVVSRLDGYGMEERRLQAVQNGASAFTLTHWANGAAVPAAGDGPAWWVDTDSRFGRFVASAGLQFYQTTAAVGGPWGARIWGTDGVSFPLATPLADFAPAQVVIPEPFFAGPAAPATDPLGGSNVAGFYANFNFTRRVSFVNSNGGANANMAFVVGAGAQDFSTGGNVTFTQNSAAAGAGALLGQGPQTASIRSASTNAAPFDIFSLASGPLRFGFSGAGGEVFRLDNTTKLIQAINGLTAAGAVAVAITNAPAGVGATPAEYLKVLGTGGATRYIPLLG